MAETLLAFRPVLRALLRRGQNLGRNDHGATAIEFAILAVPFFAVIGAILETAVVFLASQFLDSAVQDSARLISTGQAQVAKYTAADYRDAICDGLYGLFDCTAVKIKVSVISDFASATVPPPVDPVTGAWQVAEGFSPGAGKQVVMVQAYYKWPTILDFGGFNLQSGGNGVRLMGAVRVFANEPF